MEPEKSPPMDHPNLQDALRRARDGDRDAFAKIYYAFSPRVLGLCRKLLRSPEEAEDARSEVFIRAQQGLNGYDTALPFSRWIMRIAGNHCVDRLRRKGLEKRIFRAESLEAEEAFSPGPSPLGRVLAREERRWLREAVDALPDRYRQPILLRFYCELDYDEIAESLGVNRSQVATLLFRGRQELRRSLEAKMEANIQ